MKVVPPPLNATERALEDAKGVFLGPAEPKSAPQSTTVVSLAPAQEDGRVHKLVQHSTPEHHSTAEINREEGPGVLGGKTAVSDGGNAQFLSSAVDRSDEGYKIFAKEAREEKLVDRSTAEETKNWRDTVIYISQKAAEERAHAAEERAHAAQKAAEERAENSKMMMEAMMLHSQKALDAMMLQSQQASEARAAQDKRVSEERASYTGMMRSMFDMSIFTNVSAYQAIQQASSSRTGISSYPLILPEPVLDSVGKAAGKAYVEEVTATPEVSFNAAERRKIQNREHCRQYRPDSWETKR